MQSTGSGPRRSGSGSSRVEGYSHVVDPEARRALIQHSTEVLQRRGRVKLRADHGTLRQQEQRGNVAHTHAPDPAAAPTGNRPGGMHPAGLLREGALQGRQRGASRERKRTAQTRRQPKGEGAAGARRTACGAAQHRRSRYARTVPRQAQQSATSDCFGMSFVVLLCAAAVSPKRKPANSVLVDLKGGPRIQHGSWRIPTCLNL